MGDLGLGIRPGTISVAFVFWGFLTISLRGGVGSHTAAALGLLLVLCSGIPGGTRETLCSVRDPTGVTCVQGTCLSPILPLCP